MALELGHVQSTIFALCRILAPASDFTLLSCDFTLLVTMPGRPHTMPESDKEVQIKHVWCLPAKDITMMSMCGKSCPQDKIQEIKNRGIVVIKDGEDGVLPLHRCSLCIGMYFQNIDLTYIHYCLLQNPVLAVPTAVMGAQPSGTIYIAALEILRAVGAVEWPSSSATSQTSAYRHSKLCQSLGENKKNKV